MRKGALLLIFVASILAPSAGHAKTSHAKKCPADPYKASQAVWNWGLIRTGEQATAVHPCGRKITCIGGRFDPAVKRSCHWD